MQVSNSIPPGVMLRRAERAERADAAAIRRLIWRERLNPMGLNWRHFTLAVDADGNCLGCAQVKPHGDGTRELASLVVVPAWRGQGLARALIRHFQTQAGPPLYLTCRAELEPLYARFGFRSLGEAELPPYFLRLRRIANFLFRLARREDGMCIMCWDGG